MRAHLASQLAIFTVVFLVCVETATPAEGDLLIISAGVSSTSEKPFNPLGEYENKSNQYSLRYEGRRFGLRLDRSVHGDDDGNTYLTGDILFRPSGPVVLGAGLSYSTHPLRGIGRQQNLHAMVGVEYPDFFDKGFGLGGWFDHSSNGHIHRIIGWDGVPNPPRNVISGGLIKVF
jgi:hypothetical protein